MRTMNTRGCGRAQMSGMGSWLSDAFSNINWNPTYSPVWQTVAPVVDVVSMVTTGIPVATAISTAANVIDPRQAAPPPAPSAPIYYAAPAPAAAAAAPTTAPAAGEDNTLLWVGGAAALGLGAWLVFRRKG